MAPVRRARICLASRNSLDDFWYECQVGNQPVTLRFFQIHGYGFFTAGVRHCGRPSGGSEGYRLCLRHYNVTHSTLKSSMISADSRSTFTKWLMDQQETDGEKGHRWTSEKKCICLPLYVPGNTLATFRYTVKRTWLQRLLWRFGQQDRWA